MQKFIVNGNEIRIKTHKFEGKQSLDFYINQIYTALKKIGVSQNYININSSSDSESFAEVEWRINGKSFKFKCDTQDSETCDMGAITQAIQEDIRQITRGIKDLDLVMMQYETSTIKSVKKKDLFSFENKNSKDTFSVEDLKIDKVIDEKLDSKFEYLLKYDNDKIDILYIRLKEECFRKNMPDHPTFKALKIIRQKRGLKL